MRMGRIGIAIVLVGLLVGPVGCATAPAVAPPSDAPVVVLLHGLGRTERVMKPMAARLEEAGFRTHRFTYPSLTQSPEEIVERLHAEVEACCAQANEIHFVTHSLGGVIARAYLAEHRPDNLGRVVMVAPPNRGTEIVDAFDGNPLFRWAMGPTAVQLGTGSGTKSR